MNKPSSFFALVLGSSLLSLAACSSGETEPPAQSASDAKAFDAQSLPSPCDVLTREEVTQTLGRSLADEPYRVLDAENVKADSGGSACAYPLPVKGGFIQLAIEIDTEGAMDAIVANEVMGDVVERELLEPAPRTDDPPADDNGGWDEVIGLPGERAYRLGHVAVLFGDRSGLVPVELLDRLALLVRGKIVDKPIFHPDGGQDSAAGGESRACALLTRAEAEAVLGPLALDPYPSHESTALFDARGSSCTYYSRGHKALVLKPEWEDGRERFGWAAGSGKQLRAGTGGADRGDILDGPWEQATAGMSGALYLLDGDVMLEVVYRTSATDLDGAAKLAALAMPRLKAGS